MENTEEDEINVPIALSAFRDKGKHNLSEHAYIYQRANGGYPVYADQPQSVNSSIP